MTSEYQVYTFNWGWADEMSFTELVIMKPSAWELLRNDLLQITTDYEHWFGTNEYEIFTGEMVANGVIIVDDISPDIGIDTARLLDKLFTKVGVFDEIIEGLLPADYDYTYLDI